MRRLLYKFRPSPETNQLTTGHSSHVTNDDNHYYPCINVLHCSVLSALFCIVLYCLHCFALSALSCIVLHCLAVCIVLHCLHCLALSALSTLSCMVLHCLQCLRICGRASRSRGSTSEMSGLAHLAAIIYAPIKPTYLHMHVTTSANKRQQTH